MPGIGSRPPAAIPRPGRTVGLGRRTFTAQYSSNCASCGAGVLPGDLYFVAPGNEAVSGLDCCGDRDDADLTVTQRSDTEDDGGLTVDASQVMPRGRTVGDACPRCWQVPANNGACGCHD